jgi:hypothetical protein
MHPLYKTMIATAVLGGALLALGGVFSGDEHGVKWILGGIGWFGFLACALVLIVLVLAALGRSVRRRIVA